MFLNTVSQWLTGGGRAGDRRPAKSSLQLESLEARECMSWSTVPATFAWPASTDVSFNSNARSGTATISNNEVDVYNFVAPRSGTYTFDAGKNGSMVDTIAGLYRWNGARIAGDDDSGDGTNSRFTAYLTGGGAVRLRRHQLHRHLDRRVQLVDQGAAAGRPGHQQRRQRDRDDGHRRPDREHPAGGHDRL